MLINNAGFGSMGDFVKLDLNHELDMIQLNIRAVVDLTHRFLAPMRERKRGTIINVASTAAFPAGALHGDVCGDESIRALVLRSTLGRESFARSSRDGVVPGRDGNKLFRGIRNGSSADAHDPNAGGSSRNGAASVAT